jgi:hypothetical protein
VGKRSDFKRRPQDHYNTIDPRAVAALLPHLNGTKTFAEPCAGDRHLVRSLEAAGLRCTWNSDLSDGLDARRLRPGMVRDADIICTNPPWSRGVLHDMIVHFQSLKPTWLLFDSDWANNRHAVPYLAHCSDIVAVGRLKWIEGSAHSGKDNTSWYRFWYQHQGPTVFHGRG